MLATQIRAADEFRCTKPTIRLFTVDKLKMLKDLCCILTKMAESSNINSPNMLGFGVVGQWFLNPSQQLRCRWQGSRDCLLLVDKHKKTLIARSCVDLWLPAAALLFWGEHYENKSFNISLSKNRSPLSEVQEFGMEAVQQGLHINETNFATHCLADFRGKNWPWVQRSTQRHMVRCWGYVERF